MLVVTIISNEGHKEVMVTTLTSHYIDSKQIGLCKVVSIRNAVVENFKQAEKTIFKNFCFVFVIASSMWYKLLTFAYSQLQIKPT